MILANIGEAMAKNFDECEIVEADEAFNLFIAKLADGDDWRYNEFACDAAISKWLSSHYIDELVEEITRRYGDNSDTDPPLSSFEVGVAIMAICKAIGEATQRSRCKLKFDLSLTADCFTITASRVIPNPHSGNVWRKLRLRLKRNNCRVLTKFCVFGNGV